MRITSYRLTDGSPGAVWEHDAMWSTALGSDNRHVFASDRNGLIWVLDGRRLRPKYRLRGNKPASGRPTMIDNQTLIVPFGDRILRRVPATSVAHRKWR